MLAEKLPPEFTGSGNQALSLARALKDKCVDVVFLCSSPSEEGEGFSEEVRTVCLAVSSRPRMRSLQFAVKAAFWLVKERDAYDLLHVHGYCWATISSMLVSKLLGKRTLYKVTLLGDDDLLAIYESRFGWVKNIFMSKFDSFVAISDRIYKVVEDFLRSPAKVFLIPNGVEGRFCLDSEATKRSRDILSKKFGLEEQCKIVSYVGSIEYRKGIDVLARVWPDVVSAMPETRLFLVGPCFEGTPFHGWLKEALAGYIGKTVFLTGNVSDPENYYRASDVFVFPSRSEGLPNAILEAMACGAACVVSRIEGVTDCIITDGHDGMMVEQEDRKSLAKAILTLLENSELRDRLAANAADTVQRKFRMDRVVERYVKLYQKLLHDKVLA